MRFPRTPRLARTRTGRTCTAPFRRPPVPMVIAATLILGLTATPSTSAATPPAASVAVTGAGDDGATVDDLAASAPQAPGVPTAAATTHAPRAGSSAAQAHGMHTPCRWSPRPWKWRAPCHRIHPGVAWAPVLYTPVPYAWTYWYPPVWHAYHPLRVAPRMSFHISVGFGVGYATGWHWKPWRPVAYRPWTPHRYRGWAYHHAPLPPRSSGTRVVGPAGAVGDRPGVGYKEPGVAAGERRQAPVSRTGTSVIPGGTASQAASSDRQRNPAARGAAQPADRTARSTPEARSAGDGARRSAEPRSRAGSRGTSAIPTTDTRRAPRTPSERSGTAVRSSGSRSEAGSRSRTRSQDRGGVQDALRRLTPSSRPSEDASAGSSRVRRPSTGESEGPSRRSLPSIRLDRRPSAGSGSGVRLQRSSPGEANGGVSSRRSTPSVTPSVPTPSTRSSPSRGTTRAAPTTRGSRSSPPTVNRGSRSSGSRSASGNRRRGGGSQ